ncbi:MAG: signal peptidase I [Candidatus Peribacteria bacterium]|jgi:signal peptidase I|nr:signal peptidase I [Candidatus Peribacteria bacterium]
MFDLLAFLIFVFGIILCIRFFITTPYTVLGSSMMPTIAEKDRVIVEKLTQRFSSFQRGDIIVFVPPGKTLPYIKRVIGLP